MIFVNFEKGCQEMEYNFLYTHQIDWKDIFKSAVKSHFDFIFRTHVVILRESSASLLPFALSAPEILLINTVNLEIWIN